MLPTHQIPDCSFRTLPDTGRAVNRLHDAIAAETPTDGYRMPPKPIADIIDAPWTAARVDLAGPAVDAVAPVSGPAGHRTGCPSRNCASPASASILAPTAPAVAGRSMSCAAQTVGRHRVRNYRPARVAAYVGCCLLPDSKWIAFTQTEFDHIELWIVDIDKKSAGSLSIDRSTARTAMLFRGCPTAAP